MKQTDNDSSMLEVKIELRERLVRGKEKVSVLECFSGDGILWKEVKARHPECAISILRIDMKPDKKGIYLRGDNLKFISSMDLSVFDIIDLDAYGSPFPQLQLLFKKKYSGMVVCTFIQTVLGQLNKSFLEELGFTQRMIKKCPTLFNISGFDKMKSYLAKKGVKKILAYSENRKNYFSFHV